MAFSPKSGFRIRIELVEADVEQAFGLVDLAEDALRSGDGKEAVLILADAERVFADIQQRLAGLTPERAQPFTMLIAELRLSIEQTRRHCA